MASRRQFMALIGGGVVVAAGAGGYVWASTRDPVKARAPWRLAGSQGEDPRLKALSYAVLAPNSHNRQPWLADMSVPDEVTLYCQADRRLPETDPYDRQITIGLGCFLELMDQAAAQDGYRLDTALFPDGEPQPRLDDRPVARVRFVRDEQTPGDPLFAYILERRSNKEPYDTARDVSTQDLERMAAVARSGRVGFTNEPARVAMLREKAWAAMEVEMHTPATLKESIDLVRVGRAEIEANPDGIELSGPMFELLSMTGLMTRDSMLDTSSTAFKQQMKAMRAPFDTAMAFAWQVSAGNSRADQIAAGRDYVRLNLAATGAGLSMQPFSQALQEFPEMRDHYADLRDTLSVAADETIQMYFRLGYGKAVKPSPRWPVQTRLL